MYDSAPPPLGILNSEWEIPKKESFALRRILTLIALVLVPVALWVLVVRLSGPRVSPLPAELPYVIRHPPPSQAVFAQPKTGLNPDEEVRRLHARGIMGRHVGIAIIDRPLLTRHQEFADRLR